MREWKLGFLIEVCLRLCRFELIRPTVGDCEIFSHHSHNALESFLGNAVGNFHPEPAPQEILHRDPLAIEIHPLRPCANLDDALQLTDSRNHHTRTEDHRAAQKQEAGGDGVIGIKIGFARAFALGEHPVVKMRKFIP